MKRTPLTRRTPMPRQSSPLRRTARLAVTAPVKPKRQRDTGPSPKVRAIVRERAGDGRCEWPSCESGATAVHHRRPRRAGGSSDPATNLPANLIYFCTDHHAWVESHRAEALVFGLLLPATADPRTVPVVTRHAHDAVLLDDEGGWHVAPE